MIPLRSQLFRKVTIVGVGLMGGSLGLAIKKAKLAREVVGFSQRASSLQTAEKMQAIDQGFQDLKKAVANADLVVLCTPVSIISGMIKTLGPALKRNCIVTDVGSAKVPIVRDSQDLPGHVAFVGSHPLAGSEKAGVQYASADLYNDSLCVMTPTDKTSRAAVTKVKRLWTHIGCKVKFMPAEEHDRIMAYISHLPHVLAYVLMGVIPEGFLEYAGQGLRDTTRIAGSSPQMWGDICGGNSANIIHAIDEVVKDLAGLRKGMSSDSTKSLVEYFHNAKIKRDKIS